MDLSPRKVFADLMHDLHDLNVLFDTKAGEKCLSNLETDILNSFYKNLSLTFKLGYSIDSLSSTKLHSHLSLLLEFSTELLSRNIEKEDVNYLENFLSQVLNIYRLMFQIGFYGNDSALRNNKDISKIRNLLLNSIQVDLSIKCCEHLYKKYMLPIFFNFIFYTDEWIEKFNRILPEPCFVSNHQADTSEKLDAYELKTLCDSSKTDLDFQSDSSITNDESDSSQSILFVPFQLKSIALKTVRNLLISNLGKDGFYNFYKDSLIPSQLCDDIRFVEQARTRIYCDNLFVTLEICPNRLRDVISQQFCISNDASSH